MLDRYNSYIDTVVKVYYACISKIHTAIQKSNFWYTSIFIRADALIKAWIYGLLRVTDLITHRTQLSEQ